MVGKEDKITPIGSAQQMHDIFSNSTLKIIPHAGHVSNLENPAAFNFQLAMFMELVTKKSFSLSDADALENKKIQHLKLTM